jgi:DNA-binding ferritin-like protein
MTIEQGAEVAGILQDRLNALNDLALTLKHIHWNVVGSAFHRRAHHARPAGGGRPRDG